MKILLVSLLSLMLVSYVDYVTGYELLFFVFYFIPVALCGWYLRLRTTLAMALISGISWFLVDWASGHLYPHEALRYWNAFICFSAFASIGLILHHLRRAQREQERIRKELAKALDEVHRSTEAIRQLQSELQVVCAWTKQVRVNDQWIPVEQFLSDKLHLSISHGMSPGAFENLKGSLKQSKPE